MLKIVFIVILFLIGSCALALAETIKPTDYLKPGEKKEPRIKFIKLLPYGIMMLIATLIGNMIPLPRLFQSNSGIAGTSATSSTNVTNENVETSGHTGISAPEYETSAKENSYPGCIDLVRDTPLTIDLSGNGTVDTISFSADIIEYGAKRISITVNGKKTTLELNTLETFRGVCAVDIDLSDEYRNILVCSSMNIYVYTYNDNENLTLINQLGGYIDSTSFDGSGKLTYYHTGVLSDTENNLLVTQYIDSFSGKKYTHISDTVGIMTGSSLNQFKAGFYFHIFEDTPLYTDRDVSNESKVIIPADTIIEIVECNHKNRHAMVWTYRVIWDKFEGWIRSPYDF